MQKRQAAVAAKQFARFNAVGMLNTAVDFAVFALLVWFGLHKAAAQCISYAAGMANSYAWNRRWTFRTADEQAADRRPRRWLFQRAPRWTRPTDEQGGDRRARRWTFRPADEQTANRRTRAEIIRFLAWNGMLLALSAVLLVAFADGLGMPAMAAKLLATAVTVVLGFAGSKLWVFRSQ